MKLKQFFIFTMLFATHFISSPAQASILSGVWRSSCQLGISKQQIFTDVSSETSESFFQDRSCSRPAFQFRTTGQIQFSEENPEFINFTYAEVALSVYTQQVVDDLNARKVCGFTGWKIAKEKIITGLKCALFNVKKEAQIAKVNDKKFGIYRLEKDKLFFGQLTRENDGSSPGKRPLILDPTFYLKAN